MKTQIMITQISNGWLVQIPRLVEPKISRMPIPQEPRIEAEIIFCKDFDEVTTALKCAWPDSE